MSRNDASHARPGRISLHADRAPLEKKAPAAIYPVIDGIFDGDRLAAPAPKKGPGAQRLPVLSCTTVYPLLQTCQCTLLTRFTRRFWRKSGAKLQPFFQPHKFFTHFFQKKLPSCKKTSHPAPHTRTHASVSLKITATGFAELKQFTIFATVECYHSAIHRGKRKRYAYSCHVKT